MLEIAAGAAQLHHLHQRIGKRLESIFGQSLVTRNGSMPGFLVAFGTGDRAQSTALVAQALQQITEVELDCGNHGYALTARAGVIWTDDLTSPDPEPMQRTLVSAVVAARRNHRSLVVIASRDNVPRREIELTARLLCDLPAAMRENRLSLNAQSIVPCRPQPDADPEVEILLQMQDRGGSEYLAPQFLPQAEKSVLIEMVDRWVLHRVLVDFGPQLRARPRLLVSINVSAPSLGNPDFGSFLSDSLHKSQIEPRRIQLEITETSIIHDLNQARANIHEARRLGCRIALDDFGSGLSSYGYIKTFEPDCIKIDGAFIPKVVNPANVEAKIVRSIIDLAHRLDIEVVAEHVSSQEILTALQGLGVDKVQGYELGRPRSLSQLFADL